MKKLILFSIMGLLLLTSISAFDFDNIKSYDEETKTITIRNSLLYIIPLSTIVEIQLTTPLSIELPLGYNNFANLTITGYTNEEDILDAMNFYDRKVNLNKFDKDNLIDRDFDILVRSIEEYFIDDFGYVPTGEVTKNGTIIKEWIKVGEHIEERIVWNELSEINIKESEKLEIELWTEIKNGDKVEWIPNFIGVEVNEWAGFNATGGTITFDGDFQIHTFTTNGTFTIIGSGNIEEILIIAGGGSGGSIFTQIAGGGGAGGLVFNDENLSMGAGDYPIYVGVGGTAITDASVQGISGQNSSALGLVAFGGAGGGTGAGGDNQSGLPGGSGGGAGWIGVGGVSIQTNFSNATGYGHNGGDGNGAGGGGAGNVGETGGAEGASGDGGTGRSYDINGTSTCYAGGGGGGMANSVDLSTATCGGGAGGGGQTYGTNPPNGVDALDGTGGGGGGAGYNSTAMQYIGGDGGDGVVIIRFLPISGPIPIITLNDPANNTIFQTNEISLNCTGSDDINLVNVSLILDGVVNETNTPANNTLTNFDKIVSVEDHNWTCRAADNNSQVTTAETRFFSINISVGTELVSPTNNQNLTSSLVNFVFNSTPINQDLVSGNITVWFSNGTVASINGTDLSGSSEVQSNLSLNLSQSNYIWTANTVGELSSNTTINRTFNVHTTPSQVVINFPKGNIASFALGDSLVLNWTISEPGQNLSEHIINCSFTYNGVETFLDNLSVCIETNTTTFLYVNGVNNLSFKVQEEFGFNTTNTTSWTFSVLEINQTFNNETIEGSLEDFEAQIKLGGGLSISAAALIYNGTTNVGSSSTTGGITTLTATNVLVSSVTADINLSFVWALILSDSSQINLTIKNQTVLNLDLDNCGVFTNRIFNFTSVDEEEQTILVNTTQEIAVNIFSLDRSELVLNLSDEYTSNPTLICLNINLTSSTTYSIDVIVRYSAEDPNYAIEYFNIVNLELTNDTEEQVVTLFDLNLSDSTEFQLTFTGQDFLPVENALVFIERQYIAENTFKTVELPKTDSNGQTVLHLVRNDVLYNIIVVKDNVVLGSFSNLIAFCDDFTIGDCKISLNAIGEETGVFNYDEGVGILYDTQPVYNASTSLVSFDFISSDGESKIVTLTVERRDVFGNTSICSSTVISVGGTVFCNTGNVTDATLFTSIFVDEEEWINSQVSVDTSTYGSIGYVALFFISLLLILAFGDSKNGTIFALLIGYLIAITMGWIVGGIIGPTSSGIWIIVLTIVAVYQINKNRIT